MFTITQSTQRVLVADDEPVIRQLVTSALEREGFKAVTANNGRDAYRLLQVDDDFKAVIFDMMMPGLKGIDIIRYMQTEKRLMRIPALMITSATDLKLMSDSFVAGAVLFLPKPFTREQLHTTLGMLLAKQTVEKDAA